ESYLLDMAFEDCFPRRDRLTGEYYIGSECYSVADNPCRDPVSGVVFVPRYRVNFRVRCLLSGELPGPTQFQPVLPQLVDALGLAEAVSEIDLLRLLGRI